MRRFFVEQPLSVGARARLSPEETKHAARVLRLAPGAEVLLLNGLGLEARARLLSLEAEGAEAEVLEVKEITKPVRLELLQAPLKGPKMDWLVEKLTELGVDALRPARTERTVAAGEKEDRWARIAQAAVKQSGNATFPKLHPLVSFDEALAQLPAGAFRVHLQPGAAGALHEVISRAKAGGARTVILAIGPEGGFSTTEEEKLTQAGFVPASLSRQVLRGETAALAALAIAAHCIDFSA
jgi:16S rRNA (uracil1498-N3)-methyltransferase